MEVIKNEPFENEKYGKGQYTYKIYHLQQYVTYQVSTTRDRLDRYLVFEQYITDHITFTPSIAVRFRVLFQ